MRAYSFIAALSVPLTVMSGCTDIHVVAEVEEEEGGRTAGDPLFIDEPQRMEAALIVPIPTRIIVRQSTDESGHSDGEPEAEDADRPPRTPPDEGVGEDGDARAPAEENRVESLPCDPGGDFDDDGVNDCEDSDADGDGVLDSFDNCLMLDNPYQVDMDNDGHGDPCDSDIDGDGVDGDEDCDDLDPMVSPLAVEVCDGVDNSCDGLVDAGFQDSDSDGFANCIDPDDDGDGVFDAHDNCPKQKNIDQGDFDSDGLGDMCDMDADGDGIDAMEDCNDLHASVSPLKPEVCDGVDNNCDGIVDEGFADDDYDGLANCVDADDDNDGWLDGKDNCPSVFNPKQEDADSNGKGDACQWKG